MRAIPTMIGGPAEQCLIDACRRGDREAFRVLYETYQERVFSIALCFFRGDRATAEDVAQEVFVRLFTRIDRFEGRSSFTTWLYRVVANECLDERRRRKRLEPLAPGDEASPGAEGGVWDAVCRRDLAESVRRAIGELKPEYRITILLRYFDELSYQDMAHALNCSVGTVASRLNRCHRILARKLSHLSDRPGADR